MKKEETISLAVVNAHAVGIEVGSRLHYVVQRGYYSTGSIMHTKNAESIAPDEY